MMFSFRLPTIKKLSRSRQKSREGATVTSRTQLDRNGLPSETLELRIIREGDRDWCWRDRFKGIYVLAHR
jgi:hypothetical protein